MGRLLDNLLTAEVITCLVVAAAAALALSALMRYVKDRDKLAPQIRRADKQLARTRKIIAKKKAAIEKLQAEVGMLMPVHDRLQNYHEELLQMQLQEEKRLMDEQKDDGPGVRRASDPWVSG